MALKGTFKDGTLNITGTTSTSSEELIYDASYDLTSSDVSTYKSATYTMGTAGLISSAAMLKISKVPSRSATTNLL